MFSQQPQVIKRQKKLRCKLMGHQLRVVKNYKQGQNEYTCKWCKNQFTDLDNGRVDLLTPKLHQLNMAIEHLYLKRSGAV